MRETDNFDAWESVDLHLWGKSHGLPSPYPLACHLIDTAAMAGCVWDRYLTAGQRGVICTALKVDEVQARELVMFWAGLHDIGKAIPGFQWADASAAARLVGYSQPPTSNRVKHAEAVHAWLTKALAELMGNEGRPSTPSLVVAQTLGGHHGCYYGLDHRLVRDPLVMVPELGDGRWQEQRELLLRMMWLLTGSPAEPAAFPKWIAPLVCGVVVLSDWLVSQESFLVSRLPLVPVTPSRQAFEEHFNASAAMVPRLLSDAGLLELQLKPGTFTEEFPEADPAFPLQRSIAEELPGVLDGPGILVVPAPTGEGKTETALHAARLMAEASGASGVVLAVPTMATADQMFGRLQRYAQRRAVGTASQTLLHSMAALNPEYTDDEGSSDDLVLTGEGDSAARVLATEWLRVRRRGVLARLSVCTVDHVLMAVLPVKYNALRMLGLTGKVLIVDEAHAYDPYMQGLLKRSLRWLGRYRVPVILLSATMPKQVTRELVDAYLGGSGRPPSEPGDIVYPGWVYADARRGYLPPRQVDVTRRSLAVELRPVRVGEGGMPDRSPVLRELLAPTLSRGCALVICTTVAEAQRTYSQLHDWFGTMSDALDLYLLHARFPVWQRREITNEIMRRFGRDGEHRPDRAVVVATQVVEQSLDLDFDLVISDLAPMALLLQRAGRCWRHRRPARVRGSFTGPSLGVLVPMSAGSQLLLPRAWRMVYDESLLIRTYEALAVRTAPIDVPGDVQDLVDMVYDLDFAAGLTVADTARLADDEVKAQLARMVAIPAPGDRWDLRQLTDPDVDEDLIATRLGADSVRVLCCYETPTGDRYLDRGLTEPLPVPPRNGRRLSKRQVRRVLEHTIPVRAGAWLQRADQQLQVPAGWSDTPWLSSLVVIALPVRADGTVEHAVVGGRSFRLDERLGLVNDA